MNGWDLSSVADMSGMFVVATSLEIIQRRPLEVGCIKRDEHVWRVSECESVEWRPLEVGRVMCD